MKKIFALTFAIVLTGVSYSQTENEVQGNGSGASITTGDFNTFYGDSSGYSNTSGSSGIMIGYKAGLLQTSQFDNIVIGAEANDQGTSGTDNVYIGTRAARANNGTDNVVIGVEAGTSMSGYANDNVIIGEEAGESLIDGDDNVFIGEDAGFNTTSASDNTFVGSAAGRSNTTGYRNTFIGNEAGYDNTTGFWNTFIGDSSGLDGSTGIGNTFVGHAAGPATEYGSHNTFVGNNAGWDNNRTNNPNQGSYNTYFGSEAGRTNREGQYNVGLGAYADFVSTGQVSNDNNGTVFIGYNSLVDENYGIAIGYSARTYGTSSIVMGSSINYGNSNTDYSIGIGASGYAANSLDAVAIGREHYLNPADRSIAVGAYDTIISDDAIAIGYDAYAGSTANYSVALGHSASVNSDSSMALGYNATIGSGYVNTIAMGTNASSTSNNSFILGDASNPIRMGIGTTAPNSFAAIDLSETDKGFMLNRLTTTLRTTLGSSLGATEQGLMVYDTDLASVYTWDGTAWVSSTDTDTDTQLTEAQVDAYVANNGYLTSFSEVDGDVTNELQDVTLTGNDLGLTGSGTTVDLSPYLDNTDTQLTEVEVDAYVANNGYLTSFSEVDGDITNELQDVTLTGNTLGLTGSVTTVDLSTYLDNTDTQLTEVEVDAYVANNGYLTSFSEVDGDITNELQDLTLTGNTLGLTSSGTTVDLSSLADNTDEQNLTAATLTGTLLQIDIENGASVTVDLAPLLAGIEAQLNDHETRITELEGCACDTTGLWLGDNGNNELAILYQNIPNPFNNTSSIKYYIPSYATTANLVISNSMGQIISNNKLSEVGEYGVMHVNADGLSAGAYYYTLYVNQSTVDTKTMLIE